MSRDLTQGEYLVGLAGVGLVRLHRSGDASAKHEIRGELANLLERLDEPPYDHEMLGEDLDLSSGYERWAAVYDLPGNPVVETEQPVVWHMLDVLPGEPVLDAACGTGRHLAHLIAGGRSAVGVDASPGMLAQARLKLPGADLRQADLLGLPVDDGSVGGAVCALALEHVEDLAGAYRELARVVRPGGWVVVSTTHPTIRSVLGWGAWFVDESGRGEVPTHPQSVSDHLNAASGAGLRLVRMAEPTISDELVPRLSAGPAPVSVATAMRGMPVVMVCQYDRAEL